MVLMCLLLERLGGKEKQEATSMTRTLEHWDLGLAVDCDAFSVI